MNRYLEKFNKIIDELDKETNQDKTLGNTGYGLFTRVLIADELATSMQRIYEDKGWELTDEQQELLIEIIHNFYLDTNVECSVYRVTTAVCNTMQDYESFSEFVEEYNTNYPKVKDRFIWCLSDMD